jgi:glyoxylase-like metal-dependent hydrolase (beta-lactamase superfamily II)
MSAPSYPDGASVFEVSPEVSVFPIRAATSPPFLHTNLVIVRRAGATVIVDPGGYDEEALSKALSTIKSKENVFILISHKHLDHWQSLNAVLKVFPEATLCGSQPCLDYIKLTWPKRLVASMSESTKLLDMLLVPTPGHTDGDITLIDPSTGLACVGDHCVGVGSSLLDAECGGGLIGSITIFFLFIIREARYECVPELLQKASRLQAENNSSCPRTY